MDQRQKAKDLVALACDDRTPEKERVASAVKAVLLISKHDLLSSPLDGLFEDNETIQAGKTIFDAIMDPKVVSSAKKIASRIRKPRRR